MRKQKKKQTIKQTNIRTLSKWIIPERWQENEKCRFLDQIWWIQVGSPVLWWVTAVDNIPSVSLSRQVRSLWYRGRRNQEVWGGLQAKKSTIFVGEDSSGARLFAPLPQFKIFSAVPGYEYHFSFMLKLEKITIKNFALHPNPLWTRDWG